MSTQYYTPDQQNYTLDQQTAGPQRTGPSRPRRGVLAVVAALAVAVVALALALWHAPSSAAPATHGTPTATSVPAHPVVPATPTPAAGGNSQGGSAS